MYILRVVGFVLLAAGAIMLTPNTGLPQNSLVLAIAVLLLVVGACIVYGTTTIIGRRERLEEESMPRRRTENWSD